MNNPTIKKILTEKGMTIKKLMEYYQNGNLKGKVHLLKNDGPFSYTETIYKDGTVIYPITIHLNASLKQNEAYELAHETFHAMFNIFFNDEEAKALWEYIKAFVPDRSENEKKKLSFVMRTSGCCPEVIDIYHALGLIDGELGQPANYYDQPSIGWNRNNIEEIYVNWCMLAYDWESVSRTSRNYLSLLKSFTSNEVLYVLKHLVIRKEAK